MKAGAQRLLMAAAAARLGPRSDPLTRSVVRALAGAAAARLSPAEREWIARIEDRRERIAGFAHVRDPEELGVFDIARAVRWMSIPPALGLLLMRLVRELSPASCLEIGTGFGISAAYQAAALELAGQGRLVTVDVAPGPAAIASEGLAELGLERRVDVLVGEAGEVLRSALEASSPVDFALIDADHRPEATLRDFEAVAPHLGAPAVLVFDDVGLSWAGMREAWRLVRAHPRVTATAHLGRLGLALLRE